jgi:hypothetical protein
MLEHLVDKLQSRDFERQAAEGFREVLSQTKRPMSEKIPPQIQRIEASVRKNSPSVKVKHPRPAPASKDDGLLTHLTPLSPENGIGVF